MSKDFLNELIDELIQLQNEQKRITLAAPASPKAVLAVVDRVIRSHQITSQDLMNALSFRSAVEGVTGVRADELQLVKDLETKESPKAE